MNQRTDTERLRLLAEYIEGVEPITILRTNIYNHSDDQPYAYVIGERDTFVLLGIGDTLPEALDAFCDYFEREYPPSIEGAG